MLRFGIAFNSGALLFVLAQSDAIQELFPLADLVVQGGALAVLAWAVWYAYRHMIPKQQESFEKALTDQQARFTKTLDDMAERSERIQLETLNRHERWENARHEDSEKVAGGLSQLAVNCAAMRAGSKRKETNE